MRSPINERFARLVADRSHHPAIVGLTDGSLRTIGDVGAEACAMAASLRHAGLTAGACVLVHVGNHPAFLSLFLGCLESGLPIVLLDGALTGIEIETLRRRFRATAIVTRAESALFVNTLRQPLPAGLALALWTGAEALPWEGTAPAVIRLTSGSTSLPRAIAVNEEHLVADGDQIAEAMGITPADVSLGVVPLTHAYGLGCIGLQLLLQGTTVVLRDTFTPRQLMADLDAHAVSAFFGVPFMFDYIRRNEPDPLPLRRSRLIVTAGAPIDTATLRHFQEAWRCKIHSLYGTSETGGITFDPSDDLGDEPSVGPPLPGVTVTLVPVEGSEHGRVFVQGANVTTGYVDLPGEPRTETTGVFQGGGYLTGDLARWDAGGALVLAGRVSPFVNVAGRKVHPDEIQRALLGMPGVANASVFGMPDERRGEQLVAWIQRAPGGSLTVADIRALCAKQLAPHKIPRHFVFTDEAPVDARGKISRQALEDLVRVTMGR
jgi:long-chain acyl-CoA synthetase